MNKIQAAIRYKQYQQVRLFGLLLLCTFLFLAIGLKEGNFLFILVGLIPACIICLLVYWNYKKDVELTECLKELRQQKVTIQKSLKMQDREILLLSKEGSIPEKGFKNLICVNPRRNGIFWIASLISEVHEKFEDFEMVNNSLEAVTSNSYLATIDPDTGEIKHSRLKNSR
jgi:hypothetical protein